MHHTAAEDFNPAGAFAETAALAAALEAGHIHFGAGLCEREMMGAEFYLRLLSEQLPGKLSQRSLQIGKRNILINNKSFNLMEGRRMGRVHLIGTEHTSRSDHADGQLPFFHFTHLYRRGLGTQHDIL